MGTGSGSDSKPNVWSQAPGLVVKRLVLIGVANLVKRLTQSTTRWDHARIVVQSLSGEKVLLSIAKRMLTCPVRETVDGSKLLYFEHSGGLLRSPFGIGCIW